MNKVIISGIEYKESDEYEIDTANKELSMKKICDELEPVIGKEVSEQIFSNFKLTLIPLR